jgi:hypothetical protein
MAVQYEYSSGWITVSVTKAELDKGIAGQKVAAQVDAKITEMGRQGWEFYQQTPLTVTVKGPSGCLEVLLRRNSAELFETNMFILIFRRPAE